MKPAQEDRTAHTAESDSPPVMPRWVKVFGIITIALILLAVGVKFLAGGEHGPGRHLHRSHAAAGLVS